jgi:hypothetical protein
LVLQSSPDTRPDRGDAGRPRAPRRPEPSPRRARRPAVFLALAAVVALVGAGIAAVGFLSPGGGHPAAAGAGALPAGALASMPQPGTAEGEATGLPALDGPPARAVMPTHAASSRKPAAPKSSHAPASGDRGGSSGGGTVTAGDSKAHCVTMSFPGGVVDQSAINAVSSLTGVTYNCLDVFANPTPAWSDWESPWMFSTQSDGWDAWLAANPARRVIMSMDLIPQEVSDNSNPLAWEQPCAAGDYNHYATTLAQNLVSYGAGNVIIRLGTEANGTWEADYVGTTSAEMSAWASCFDNEVSAMRAVPGAHFLFVWNPNACAPDLPINEWYPGNSYVDIIGMDAYDKDCKTLKTVGQEGWAAYSTDGVSDPNFPSIANIAAFAAANGKALSFPEWGLGSGDDPAYVTDMGQIFNQDDFSFESYFNTNGNGIAPLGSAIPNATAAYAKAF